MLAALSEQAPRWRAHDGPVAVFGAGGAAGSAIAAVQGAGAPAVRVVVREPGKARRLQEAFGDVLTVFPFAAQAEALQGVSALVNATPLGFRGAADLDLAWDVTPPGAVVVDMVTAPLDTGLLRAARARGHVTVDGLAMLIGQARPSFEAFFGVPPPIEVDVRALALRAIAERGG